MMGKSDKQKQLSFTSLENLSQWEGLLGGLLQHYIFVSVSHSIVSLQKETVGPYPHL